MDIRKTKFEVSDGLRRELAVHDKGRVEKKLRKVVTACASAEEYFGDETGPGEELRDLNNFLDSFPPSKILDVGFGPGKSSLLMAARGHSVTSLEPSRDACALLAGLAEHFGKSVKIYEGTAESAGQVQERDFDLVVYCASLHHCDEPALALSAAYSLLRPGGQLLLLNEPTLKPFRTKRWYHRMLETNPARMGHYGGNEHVYYAWEYEKMLRDAGFAQVRLMRPAVLREPRSAIAAMAARKGRGGYVYSLPRLLLHGSWLTFLGGATKADFAWERIARASLSPTQFLASK